jgi:hypothetical protein
MAGVLWVVRGEALAKYDFRPLFTIRDFGIEPTPA